MRARNPGMACVLLAKPRIGLAKDLALVPRLAGLVNLYRNHEFNDVSGSALIGIEWLHGRDRLSV
ncbi:hypothetical protein [Sphingobium fuliginis]|jgi:hypothetical protein|uniref:Uncharacterized protein n=1 Tax=Sphingobium fuliginis (strain ATCC 27551) TaxID=336203 RepID=A0A292ZGI4_SPHSA|nr:hypothetical protein [Sphingobium fuliginis]GAY22547.1 hypothetical protein SFOMI_3104 [Sphingobium fuliginis]